MTLLEAQITFSYNVSLLIQFAFKHNTHVTLGEALRPEWVQEIYFKEGKSLTKNSEHERRLAIDLNFFSNNKLLFNSKIHSILELDKQLIQPIAEFWKNLNTNNIWGGHFIHLYDPGHFEMKL